MARHNDYGKWGEDVAVEYLERHGFFIVERNWRFGHKEVDIIATDNRVLCFVEVRTRRNDGFGQPYDSVDWRKRENLMKAMNRYVLVNSITMPVRFDIVSVVGSPVDYQIEVIENGVSNFADDDNLMFL